MLTTWDQRVRRDQIKVTRLQFPVPTTQDDLYQRFENAITPRHEGLPLLPHHQSDRADVSGAAALPSGAVQRHRDHRRWSPRVGSVPIQTARVGVRRIRREPPQVVAGTDRQRLLVCAARDDPEVLATAGGPGSADQRHPEIRGDWHPPVATSGGTRRSAGVPSGHRRRAQGRAPPLSDATLAHTLKNNPRIKI